MSRLALPLRAFVAAALLVLLTPAGALAVPEGPPYPSPEWTAREAQNFALVGEAAAEQLSDPAFVARWQQQSAANFAEFAQRLVAEPYFRSEGNLCATWGEQCTGDPLLYPGVDPFYDSATVTPVQFADREGARLNGRVWAPKATSPAHRLPGVVIMNGSVQAPETAYWSLAQALVRAGFEVLTFDPRSAGRSDALTPAGVPGSNANPQAFPDNLVDALDFFASTPAQSYPYAATPAGTPFNPLHAQLDRDRVGVAGHSLGAIAATIVQGYADWPGKLSKTNPVKAIVALDNLAITASNGDQTPDAADGPGTAVIGAMAVLGEQVESAVPRVPAMGQSGDYFIATVPHTSPPDPEGKKEGFTRWRKAGVPTAQVQIRGGTHFDYSRLPTFPNRSWSVGSEMSNAYAVAWLDRWLKKTSEPGFADADTRLLADATRRPEMSVYYRNARAFPDRSGALQLCEDIRAGCLVEAATGAAASPSAKAPAAAVADRTPAAAPALAATGASALLPAAATVLLLAIAATRRRRFRDLRAIG